MNLRKLNCRETILKVSDSYSAVLLKWFWQWAECPKEAYFLAKKIFLKMIRVFNVQILRYQKDRTKNGILTPCHMVMLCMCTHDFSSKVKKLGHLGFLGKSLAKIRQLAFKFLKVEKTKTADIKAVIVICLIKNTYSWKKWKIVFCFIFSLILLVLLRVSECRLDFINYTSLVIHVSCEKCSGLAAL